MATSKKVRKVSKRAKSTGSRSASKAVAGAGVEAEVAEELTPPSWLARTSVYKRVPVAVRCRVDEAILLRKKKLATLEAIEGHFELTSRYGVSLSALKKYSRKLEQFVRPVVTSQLMAGVLGCLPDGYRNQLLAGSQVLLLSRVVKALSDQGETPLSVADLAKVASILSAVAGKAVSATGSRRLAKRSTRKKGEAEGVCDDAVPADATKMAEVVRSIYGLSWPAEGES